MMQIACFLCTGLHYSDVYSADYSPCHKRINLSSQRMGLLQTLWNSSELIMLMSYVFSHLLQAAETGTIKATDSTNSWH